MHMYVYAKVYKIQIHSPRNTTKCMLCMHTLSLTVPNVHYYYKIIISGCFLYSRFRGSLSLAHSRLFAIIHFV